MRSMSVKDARQQFAKLVNTVQQGRTVAITRRGKAVVTMTPVQKLKPRALPDLTEFRASLGKAPAPGKSRATIQHLRQQERY